MQLVEGRGGILHKIQRVVANLAPRLLLGQFDAEVAEQDLAGQGALYHARQVDGDLADDVAEGGRVQPFDLMEFVVFADVKGGAQFRHPGTACLALRHGIVGQHHHHQLVQLDVRLGRCRPVPDVEAIACGGAGEIDLDVLLHQLPVSGIHRVGQAVEHGHLVQRRPQREFHCVEQHDGPAANQGYAVTPHQAADQFDVQVVFDAETHVDDFRGGVEHAAHPVEHLRHQELRSGQDAVDEFHGVRHAFPWRCFGVDGFGNGVVSDAKEAQLLGLEGPGEDDIVAKVPQGIEGIVELGDFLARLRCQPLRAVLVCRKGVEPAAAFHDCLSRRDGVAPVQGIIVRRSKYHSRGCLAAGAVSIGTRGCSSHPCRRSGAA